MKKNKLKNQFFDELAKIPIVQVACEKTGVSRNSVYRWRREDKEFEKKMDEAIEEGVAFVNDLTESQLLTMIKEKNWPAISFWLKHRHDKYKTRIQVEGDINTIQELNPDQKKLVEEALVLAKLTIENHE